MSFDVFLQRFEGGARGIVNRDRVRAVLMSREFAGPDEFGLYPLLLGWWRRLLLVDRFSRRRRNRWC